MARYSPKKVVDVGCASGLYIAPFIEAGIQAKGYDLNDEAFDKDIRTVPEGVLEKKDITRELCVMEEGDIAICLEVLEHIPDDKADTAIANLTDVSDLIVFSAAVPGQGGEGHINCQPKSYWSRLFGQRGYYRDTDDEEWLKKRMAEGYHMGWFTQNVMVFKRA